MQDIAIYQLLLFLTSKTNLNEVKPFHIFTKNMFPKLKPIYGTLPKLER